MDIVYSGSFFEESKLVSASADKTVRLWDVDTGDIESFAEVGLVRKRQVLSDSIHTWC